MSASTTKELKQVLFDAYGGFADKRVKNLDSGRPRHDRHRSDRDEDAWGQLFAWFCQIFAEVIDQHAARITMRGGVPDSYRVRT